MVHLFVVLPSVFRFLNKPFFVLQPELNHHPHSCLHHARCPWQVCHEVFRFSCHTWMTMICCFAEYSYKVLDLPQNSVTDGSFCLFFKMRNSAMNLQTWISTIREFQRESRFITYCTLPVRQISDPPALPHLVSIPSCSLFLFQWWPRAYISQSIPTSLCEELTQFLITGRSNISLFYHKYQSFQVLLRVPIEYDF